MSSIWPTLWISFLTLVDTKIIEILCSKPKNNKQRLFFSPVKAGFHRRQIITLDCENGISHFFESQLILILVSFLYFMLKDILGILQTNLVYKAETYN